MIGSQEKVISPSEPHWRTLQLWENCCFGLRCALESLVLLFSIMIIIIILKKKKSKKKTDSSSNPSKTDLLNWLPRANRLSPSLLSHEREKKNKNRNKNLVPIFYNKNKHWRSGKISQQGLHLFCHACNLAFSPPEHHSTGEVLMRWSLSLSLLSIRKIQLECEAQVMTKTNIYLFQ